MAAASLSSAPSSVKQPEEESLWSKLLAEAGQKVLTIPEQTHLVVFGDRLCGKRSVMTRCQQGDLVNVQAQDRHGLHFTYLDIKAVEEDGTDSEDVVSRVNTWLMEGDAKCPHLKFGLNKDTIQSAAAMVVLDYSRPWTLLPTLKQWLGILEAHVSSIHKTLDKAVVAQMKEKLEKSLKRYTEPGVKILPGSSEDQELPLSDGVLTTNLGLPIVVVAAKTDCLDELRNNYNYNGAHFDFIQQHLRKVCLAFGASLVYVSAKDNKNCDLLTQVIKQKLYGFPLKVKPQTTEPDQIFVPAGWDTKSLIEMVFAKSSINDKIAQDHNAPFEEVITEPRLAKGPNAADVFVAALDEQEMLHRQHEILGAGGAAKPPPASNDSPVPSRASTSGGAASPAAPQNAVLQNFFSDLLQRNTGGGSAAVINKAAAKS